VRKGNRIAPGWIYVLTHPVWDKIGMVKIGRTGRDPHTRAAEITSVSGLIAPCTITWCAPVSDMAAAETAIHRMLGDKRVRKRRELFRVNAATARQVGEAVAGSLALPGSPWASIVRRLSAPRSAGFRYHRAAPRRSGSWCHGRRRVSLPVRLAAGVMAIGALFVLLKSLLLR
jgi:hypothetical protein